MNTITTPPLLKCCKTILAIFIISCSACTSGDESTTEPQGDTAEFKMSFNPEKWGAKEGDKYIYREQMFKDIVYNDTIRSLTGSEIIDLLGNPDRSNDGHLYYTIDQKRLGPWPLHTTTMVIKLKQDSTIEWIKISE
jgi:hypothetical protein